MRSGGDILDKCRERIITHRGQKDCPYPQNGNGGDRAADMQGVVNAIAALL